MKTCAYCGHENADDRADCSICANELAVGPPDAKPKEPRDLTWLKAAAGWIGGAMIIILCYFLSLGPVSRSFGKVISSTPPMTSSTPGTSVMVVTTRVVQYPRWVGILYAPAFLLRNSGPDGVGGVYGQYLDWWEKPQPQK